MLLIGLIVVVLISLLLNQKLFFIISYKNEFAITLKCFGFAYNVKMKRTDKASNIDNSISQTEKHSFKFDNFFSKIEDLLKLLSSINSSLKKKFECTKCELMLEVGTGDAAYTGILTGILWGTVYSLLANLQKYVVYKPSVEDVKIDIKPNFNELYLAVDFKGIFSIRLVHIIIIIGLILFSNIFMGFIKFKNKQKAV